MASPLWQRKLFRRLHQDGGEQAVHDLFALAALGVAIALSMVALGAVRLARADERLDLVLSEFMAVNDHTLADQDGDYSDWIEIHNRGPIGGTLDGWYLTDNPRDLAKWRLPAVDLASGNYLVVFASGKERAADGAELHANFRLNGEGEYLALVEPDGKSVAWAFRPTGDGSHLADVSYGLDARLQERYFTAPTPGTANGSLPANLGPILRQVGHTPSTPTAEQAITVTARVEGSLSPLHAVTLHYRVMYGDTVDVAMSDGGEGGDTVAGDGVYGASIPAGAGRPGEMVRYTITATDAAGHTSRWPLFHDAAHSPEYMGTMIADPQVTSLLPTLYWFVEDPAAVTAPGGTRASVYYAGAAEPAFYDNVLVRLRGFSSNSWPKKSLKFDFNQGHHFRFSAHEAPVEEVNLNTTSTDQAYIRQPLAWETYRDAGVPYCISFPMRIQQNGAFHSVAIFVEQPDQRYMERQGLDPNGALYKIEFNALAESTKRVQKRTRLDEDDSDLQALIDGIHLPGLDQFKYLMDHVNIPAIINYQAAATIMHDRDQGHNNYYMYRDTEGTGEWTMLPWDKDLTFGLNFNEGLDLEVRADDDPQSHPLSSYKHNDLIDALFEIPPTREMFLRRLRTLMDQLLQPPGTPLGERYYERRIDQLFTQMQLDVALDQARWPSIVEPGQTFPEAVRRLRTDYLEVRRVHLYETHGPEYGLIPKAQPPSARVPFGEIGFALPDGKADQEYLTLVNSNPYAVDLSGWTLEGAIEYTIQPGVVLPAGRTLYLSPDVLAFRTRAASPKGGEGRFVQGDYRGRVTNALGRIRLYNADGELVAARFFLDPSAFLKWRVGFGLSALALVAIAYSALGAPRVVRQLRTRKAV